MANRKTLREIAPPAQAEVAPSEGKVWLLNLDQVEPHTGRLLGKTIVDRGSVGTSTQGFDAGVVLYSKLRPYLNKVYLPDDVGLCTTELVALRPDPRLITREYLAAYLRSANFLRWVEGQVDGAKMPRVSMKVFWGHQIELPSIEEQRHITNILDKVESLRRKRQDAIRLSDHFLRASFFHSFGDSESNAMDWPVVRLEDVALQVTDGEHQTPRRSHEGIYLLSARNIQNGHLDLGDVDYVPLDEFERIRRRCEPRRGDILVSCSGSIGRVAQVTIDEPMALVRSVALVRPNKEKIRGSFLEHLLRSVPMQRRMIAASKSSAQANLFQGPIRALPVMLPPMEEQIRFENIVERVALLSVKFDAAMSEVVDLASSLQWQYFNKASCS